MIPHLIYRWQNHLHRRGMRCEEGEHVIYVAETAVLVKSAASAVTAHLLSFLYHGCALETML